MFLVISKEKVYAYIISIIAVVMLLGMANFEANQYETVQTSSNSSNELPTNNNETQIKE